MNIVLVLAVIFMLAVAAAVVSNNAAVIWQAQAAIEASKNAQSAINALALRSVLDGLLWLALLALALVWLWRRWQMYRQAQHVQPAENKAPGRWVSGPNAKWQKVGAAPRAARLPSGQAIQVNIMRLAGLSERQQLRYLLLRDVLGEEQALALALEKTDQPALPGSSGSQIGYQVVDADDDDELEW